MKRTQNFIWNAFLLVILIGLVAVTSCQKEDLNLEENQVISEEVVTRSLEKLILDRYFLVPTDGLTEEEILAKYNEMVSLMPEEAQTRLITSIEKARVRNQAGPAGQLDFRTTETVLNGTDEDFGLAVAAANNRVYIGSPEEQKVYEYSDTRGAVLLSEITPSVDAERFGEIVTVSGDWMAVAAPDAFGEPGEVFMFKKVGDNWVEQTILTGPDDETNFGTQGAVIKGNTLAVASFGVLTPFPEPLIGGKISVFTRSGDDWELSATLFRPGYEWFKIDLDDSGSRIVGAAVTRDGVGVDVQSVSIFSRGRSGWAFEQEVIAPDPDFFFPLDVVIEGNTIVFSAVLPGDRQWVFTKNGSTWEFAQELVHSGSEQPSLDMEGNRIVISGASFDDAVPDVVYAFDKIGATYELTETFTTSDGGVDVYIRDIAINGSTIAIGCPGFEEPGVPGRAYIFK